MSVSSESTSQPADIRTANDKWPYWFLAIPGIVTVLSAVSERIELSDLVRQIVLQWRGFTHVLWHDFFDWVANWLPLAQPPKGMKDLLTFSVMTIGAALTGFVTAKLRKKRPARKSSDAGLVGPLIENIASVAVLVVFVTIPAFDQVSSYARRESPSYSWVDDTVFLASAVAMTLTLGAVGAKISSPSSHAWSKSAAFVAMMFFLIWTIGFASGIDFFVSAYNAKSIASLTTTAFCAALFGLALIVPHEYGRRNIARVFVGVLSILAANQLALWASPTMNYLQSALVRSAE